MSAKTAATLKFSDEPINAELTAEQKIKLFSDVSRIRRFEQNALQQYQAGKMGGFLHLYIGQESVAVGCASLMGKNDHMITAYRNHGHGLAVGMGMNECMAELYGKKTGCSKGKGGSMHFFAPDKNYWGGHGIVAGQTPLGAGLAYGIKYQGLEGASMCFLGDGAVNQGSFHESLNMASLFDLPVVYIIENNGYSMGTSQKRSSAYPGCLAERAEGYGMDWAQVGGEDIYEVRAGVHTALERARKKSRPTLLEIATYRYKGHSVADANLFKYRTKEEVELYEKEHDPVIRWRSTLVDEGVLTEEAANKIDKEAIAEAGAAAKFADESPYPDPSEIFDDVYWEIDHKTEAGMTGRHFFND